MKVIPWIFRPPTALAKVLLVGLFCALMGGPAIAQQPDDPPKVAPLDADRLPGPSPTQEAEARLAYQKLIERREAALIQYNYIIPSKRTPARREQAFREFYPHPKDWAPRFFQVQVEYPGTVAAGRSLVWIVKHYKNSELDLQSRVLLFQHYLGQPFLLEICSALARATQPRGKQDLLHLFLHSPVDAVKAHACQALCNLDMDELQVNENETLRADLEGYVQLLASRFAGIQIAGVSGADWADRFRLEMNHLSLGQKVLDWQGEDLNGVVRSLGDTRGQVVLLYFWKSSSRPARAALPHVLGLQNKYDSEHFQVFGISGDLNRDKAKRWQDALQIQFPNWHVPSTEQDPGLWGVTSWPSFYVLSPKGRILAAQAEWEAARKAVVLAMEELLSAEELNDSPPAAENPNPESDSKGDPKDKPHDDPKDKDKDQGPLRRKDS